LYEGAAMGGNPREGDNDRDRERDIWRATTLKDSTKHTRRETTMKEEKCRMSMALALLLIYKYNSI